MSAAKKSPLSERRLKVVAPEVAPPKKARKPRDSKRELVRKARLPGIVFKRSELYEIAQDLRNQERVDAIELKLTKWWNSHGSGVRQQPATMGDLLMAMAGISSCDPAHPESITYLFYVLSTDLEVMAEHELAHRGERQQSGMHYRGDLYSSLLHLAQRCRALGAVVPRILKANRPGAEVSR